MHVELSNRRRDVVYFDRTRGRLVTDIWEYLTPDTLRKASLAAHERNMLLYVFRPDQYREVLPGLVPIPPRSRWVFDGRTFVLNDMRTARGGSPASVHRLVLSAARLWNAIRSGGVAVELSGGLDTSIVIGILARLGARPLLIGMCTDRFEFRTERTVQDTIVRRYGNAHLVPYEAYLPFKDILLTPAHQLPSPSSVFHAQGAPIAALCQEHGVSLALSGMGLDALFCDDMRQWGADPVSRPCYPWMLDDEWFNEYVYKPHGIRCVSAGASSALIRGICALRNGLASDPHKLWARSSFAEFLPCELTRFAYKADHNGLYVEGLQKAYHDICELFRVAYDVTLLNEFSPRECAILMRDCHAVDDKRDKTLLGRISFAAWIYAIMRDRGC